MIDKRRAVVMPFVCLLFVLSAKLLSASDAADAGRPNFLLIVADDLNGRDLGCTGSPDVKSPHIDRLAAEGMTLSGMFVSWPTCSPARHALYTGLYPVRSGAYPNHTMVDPATHSLFTYLKAMGYRVGLQGKQHVSPRSSFPYEYISGNADDIEAFTEFIARDEGQPWLAVFASSDPHSPWTRGPKDLYDPARITVPPYLHDNPTTRQLLAAYFAEITRLDEQVGAGMQALDDTGQRDNTLVLFLSEQGSSFPYGGKWSLYGFRESPDAARATLGPMDEAAAGSRVGDGTANARAPARTSQASGPGAEIQESTETTGSLGARSSCRMLSTVGIGAVSRNQVAPSSTKGTRI